MVETLAPRLHALLLDQFGVDAPIVVTEIDGPCLVTTSSSSGDAGGGYTTYERIELRGVATLQLTFRYAFHELTRECDDWTLDVTGAPEPTHLPIVEIFHPAQQTHPWNPSVRPEIHFYDP
jgi:hypothetical protein